MKPNTTYVDACHFEAIIAQSGLDMTPQKGFVKVSGALGRNVYVAATKRVGRVDISGFLFEGPGVRNLGDGEKFGNVHQQLDFGRSEAEILETFRAVLEHMKSLAPAEKVKRSMAPKKGPEPKGWSNKVTDRLDLIKKVAAQKGVKVSEKTLALADSEK